jgi:NAD(P)-dependent dehydrogenase (short-subunit alcohol dehydrogenase family)
MLLENKNAVVYGGSGSVGSLVAYAFACEGARVFLRAFRSSARRGSRMRTWLGSNSEADG